MLHTKYVLDNCSLQATSILCHVNLNYLKSQPSLKGALTEFWCLMLSCLNWDSVQNKSTDRRIKVLVLLSLPIWSWSADASACSLTAGGHSSNLSLWHTVNLPERNLHSARKDMQLNTTYLSNLRLSYLVSVLGSGLNMQPRLTWLHISCWAFSCLLEAKCHGSRWGEGATVKRC